MTPNEVLAFARQLPATVTRIEVPSFVLDGQGNAVLVHLVIEQAAPPVIRSAPEIGDVERAAKAKEQRPPSDVESLGHTPPEWKD